MKNLSIFQLCCILLHLLNLPLASSQQITNPNPNQCIAAPCYYKGECRDISGTCGDTVAFCNTSSQWVPACGGGAGFDKPGEVQVVMEVSAPPPPPMMNKPTMRPAVPQASATARPTTAWELWISASQNKDDSQEVNGSKEEGDVTTDHTTGDVVVIGNFTATNETDDWFNPTTWGDRPEVPEEEGVVEGVLDKMSFWDNDDSAGNAMESSRNEVILLLSVVLVWVVLS